MYENVETTFATSEGQREKYIDSERENGKMEKLLLTSAEYSTTRLYR